VGFQSEEVAYEPDGQADADTDWDEGEVDLFENLVVLLKGRRGRGCVWNPPLFMNVSMLLLYSR
jgi:hypothetical protein